MVESLGREKIKLETIVSTLRNEIEPLLEELRAGAESDKQAYELLKSIKKS